MIISGLTIKDASIEELTVESDLIVHGKIQSVRYEWDDKNLKKISTIVEVSVFEYLKGDDERTIEIVQMGGKMDDIEDIIYGTPKLNTNDEVLLFLVKENEQYAIHSIALGCYKVLTNDKNQKTAINELYGVNLIKENNTNIQSEHVKKYSFDELAKNIKSYIQN